MTTKMVLTDCFPFNLKECVKRATGLNDDSTNAAGRKKRSELSDTIMEFKEGEKTVLRNIDTFEMNLENYMLRKGPHFCAGYLSRFGEVVRPLENYAGILSFKQVKYNLRRIRESRAYNAAVKVWTEHRKTYR